MPLTWSVDKCENDDTLVSPEVWPITNAMILSTMAMGISKITKKTVEEYWIRLELFRMAGMPFMTSPDGGAIKYDQLQSFIGLETNASDLSNAKFNRNLAKTLRSRAKRALVEQEKKK